MNFFKKKKTNEVTEDSLYTAFKNGIDPLSKRRLESIDMALALEQSRFKSIGFILDEFSCSDGNSYIQRNQLGYYAVEYYSLNSKKEYEYYQYALKLLEEYKKEFQHISELYVEKETIMNGLYNPVVDKQDLENISKQLGYGQALEDRIYEDNPKHPSKEYNELVKLLRIASVGDKKDLNLLLNKCINTISKHFIKGIKISPKLIGLKYQDFPDESTYGLILIDEKLGEKYMLYEVSSDGVERLDYSRYLIDENPYLDIYMRIVSKAIKRISLIVK